MSNEELIMQTLRSASITEELRDAELTALAQAITVREYKAGTYLIQPGNSVEKDSLLILASGEAEVTASINGETATMKLTEPGDLAGIITFVGGNLAQISATVQVKQDSKVLLLERARFESLLNSQPAVVYYVMRGIVRYVHGLVRRMNAQSQEMSNYLYHMHGRY
ncbi:MAG: cyclic nucleotide-binding domain-containing protein [Pseudomonadota bacterium]